MLIYIPYLLYLEKKNGFKVPSFIDCAKVYRVSITKNVDLTDLTHREISEDLRGRINERIKKLRKDGRQSVYSISEEQFRSWNPKIK